MTHERRSEAPFELATGWYRRPGRAPDSPSLELLRSATRVMGVNEAAVSGLEESELVCQASYPDCGCPVGPSVADDGTSSDAGTPASVSCSGGVCTTTFATE